MARGDETTGYESTGYESSEWVEQDTRARKRMAIGLEPARPTAKEAVLRPPVDDVPVWRWQWLAFLVSALMLATVLLVLATLLDWPTNWNVLRPELADTLITLTTGPVVTYDLAPDSPYRRLVELDFSSPAAGLATESLPNQYEIWTDSANGFYRMRVWPDNLAWSILGKSCLGPYRVETQAAIAASSPTGYGGLLGRFQNTRNFYMFVVDGQGRYRALVQVEGTWKTLQPWTAASVLESAGAVNKLTLQDDGRTLNFLANDELLFGVSNLDLPAGNTGVIAGAGDEIADLAFDWLRLYDLPCRVQ